MYLKSLYIQGFKSFANKTKIEFNNKITGIVGPNGSGKSNISDAIMWVLGETSVKTLRGSKMEDVIFSGTDKKKPLGFAQVTIVFDNSDRSLPIEYNEVSVTRKMYRSLESEFLINNVKCRLKDIKELFMDTGIGKDGYSLIGQGKIENILSSKPENRRAIFEEAAGISKFKMKKAESERKLEKTKDNLIRLNDIILEIEKRKNLLKDQSEKAIKYKEIYKNLKDLEISLVFLEIESKKEKNIKISTEIIDLENENKNLLIQIEENEIKLKNLEYEILNLDIEISDNQELKIKKSSEYEEVKSKIEISKERILNLNTNLNNNLTSIEELNILNNRLKGLNEEKENNLKCLSESLIVLNNDLKSLKEEINLSTKKLSDLEKDRSLNNENYLLIHKNISDLDSKIEVKESLIKEKKERINSINKNLDILIDNNKELLESISLKEEKYEELLQKQKENLEQKTIKNNYLIELNKLAIKDNEKYLELKNEFELINAKHKAMKNLSENYDGYSKSVKSFMNFTQRRNLFDKSLIGTVADNLSVDEKYEKAISVALGGSIQNIIIKEESSARDMIALLNKENLGRVTFLPLDSIRFFGNQVDLSNYDKQKVLGYANELISYNAEFDNIFKSILGKTIVTSDFNTGVELSKRLNRKYRIVTLLGDSLNVGGSITGGSIYKNNISILGRSNEVKELESLKDEFFLNLENIKANISKRNSTIEELEFLVRNLENINNNLNLDVSKMKGSIENLKSSKSTNQIYLDRYESEKNNLKSSIEKDYSEIEKNISDKKELEIKEINFKNKSNDSDGELESLKEKINKLKEEESDKKIDLVKLNSSESTMKKELSDNNLRIDENLKKIENLHLEIEEFKVNINSFENTNLELNNTLFKLNEEIELLEKNIDEKKDLKINRSKELESLRENINSSNKKLNELEKNINKKEYEVEKNNYYIENIKESLISDYDLIESDIKKIVEIDSIKKSKDEIKKYKNKLNSLGDVNILAIDEYEEVNDRLEFNLMQKKDLLDAIEEIRNILNKLDVEMKEKFNSSFKLVSKYFDEIFRILFNGGRAEIEIQGDDELTGGIEIKAQPPGKRFQTLSLLSGGEKSLTAVALLFALLKVRPAPFCILDEIDAALDDANIKRYANYLLTIEDIQFIMITHRKLTMEIANKLYGVTMEEKGISKLISVELTN